MSGFRDPIRFDDRPPRNVRIFNWFKKNAKWVIPTIVAIIGIVVTKLH